MEYLVPIGIVAIGIGLFFLFRLRPTVVRPPTTTTQAKSDDPMQEILGDLEDMPPGTTKRVKMLKGDGEIGWAVTKRLDGTSLSPGDLRGLMGKGGMEQIASLLSKLEPGSVPGNAPPEARLHYPGSTLVLDSVETQSSIAGGAPQSRDVYKTTLATQADAAQVVAWYQDWLLSHGWQPSPPIGIASDSSHEYARASEHFRVAVTDSATVAPVLAIPIPVGTKTVYEVEYSNGSTQSQATAASAS
jgi:hypothetical protein